MSAALATLVLSALLCGFYLRFARSRQILDRPNERSSHSRPTPHGGGAALLLAFAIGFLLAARLNGAWDASYTGLLLAALLLMILGVIDDLRGLSVRLRLALYGLTCLLVAIQLLYPVQSESFPRFFALVSLAALAMLWLSNLYNFMDGIDGIAGIQTVLACGGAALLSLMTTGDGAYAEFCVLLAAAHCGFLVWNWPPARLFMGDAGSVPTGFLLAGLALLGEAQGMLSALCWLVLLAAFITDASWTLLWRLVTGQPITQPHRLHAYQRLSRHWGSHFRVDMLLLGLNVLWLMPIAWAVQLWPEYALFLVILAYLPLAWGMARVGRLA